MEAKLEPMHQLGIPHVEWLYCCHRDVGADVRAQRSSALSNTVGHTGQASNARRGRTP
jgi:hypothetical protein